MQLFSFAAQYLLIAALYYFLFQLVAVLRDGLHRVDNLQSGEGSVARPSATSTEDGELVVVQGGKFRKGERFTLKKQSVSLGRTDENDIVVDDPYASKRHAAIRRLRGVHQIADLGSSNGTLLNGRLVTEPVELKSGDRIQIGDAILRYEKPH
ncbi:MAG: hypothetical protein AUJ92_18770 [Armatimonadetes bacterium CG2_30_59_28]|nr:FHA domain-containing protein [Armatimonadota bacterium]OIO90456.1 MAG: hypothetical protein AUJ92_18770 [Armatimonadetes bacterium CG2_30_59_28]PIU65213.1 MAG: hypothetical protein COS85_09610 [Armatimonadetes bacterium CG07_land_8_20_14_0_80_59_28]